MEERQTVIGIGPAAATKAVNPNDWSLKRFYFPKEVSVYISKLPQYLEQRRKLLDELYS